jgi:hypothetical protein
MKYILQMRYARNLFIDYIDASTFSTPTELVKCRAQALRTAPTSSGSAQHVSSWQVAKQIFQKYGLSGKLL